MILFSVCFYQAREGSGVGLPNSVRAPNAGAAAKLLADAGYDGKIRIEDEQGVSHVFDVTTIKISSVRWVESWGWPNG